MKPLMQPLTQLLLIAFFLLIGCKDKDLILDKPGNGHQPTASNKVLLTLEALPGETTVVTDLFAVISIVNGQNQPVVTNQKVALHHDGKYLTDTLTLAGGAYKVSQFIIVDKSDVTRFATPFSGSEMGTQVRHPLAISFELPKPAVSTIAVDVLGIAAGAQPEKYGYPAGAFNLPQTEEQDETENAPNAYTIIKVRPLIKIGEVVYDSIPVAFTLTSWNSAGQPAVTTTHLSPGTNEVRLPKAAVKYDLLVSKWGTTDALSLENKDVQEGAVYTLGGSRAAKILKSELGYKMVKGVWVAESKNVFEYDGSGRLMKIIYHHKRADNSPYIHATDYFSYNTLGKLATLVKKDENNIVVSETSFSYAQDGKLTGMLQKEESAQTEARVSYTGLAGGTGISGDYGINIQYQYSHQPFSGQYSAQFKGGNKVAADLSFSNGGKEMIRYQYDFNINPFVHLPLPDIYFSRSSKHNVGAQQNGYDGNYAKSEFPAATEYSIDADGYPTQAITHYQHPFLGIYLYKTKTVYNY